MYVCSFSHWHGAWLLRNSVVEVVRISSRSSNNNYSHSSRSNNSYSSSSSSSNNSNNNYSHNNNNNNNNNAVGNRRFQQAQDRWLPKDRPRLCVAVDGKPPLPLLPVVATMVPVELLLG